MIRWTPAQQDLFVAGLHQQQLILISNDLPCLVIFRNFGAFLGHHEVEESSFVAWMLFMGNLSTGNACRQSSQPLQLVGNGD